MEIAGSPQTPPGPTDSGATPRIRLVSLNCWGLKYVSKVRVERLRAIAERLANASHYDIVALQELWVEDDFEVVRTAVSANLKYYKRFYSGIIAGPGLTVFSRWPIESSWLHCFPINGRPSAFFRGDWYVGKSVGGVVINHPCGLKVEVLSSHMHAPYGPGDASYTCHRAAQAWDISQLAKRSIASGHVTFAVGDFNSSPGSMHYDLFQKVGLLSDAWVERHGEYTGNIAELTPKEQIEIAGVTADSQLCTWRAHYPLEKATRLDYIFFDSSSGTCTDCKVAFTEPIPEIGSVSDHFGIEGEFEIRPVHQGIPGKVDDSALLKLYDEVLVTIAQYLPVSRWQATWRLAHFGVSVLLTTGLLVGVWWGAAHNRPYVGFIFIIAAVLIMVPGSVNGLIGLLFGPSERRALREFEDQVWAARSLVSHDENFTR